MKHETENVTATDVRVINISPAPKSSPTSFPPTSITISSVIKVEDPVVELSTSTNLPQDEIESYTTTTLVPGISRASTDFPLISEQSREQTMQLGKLRSE
jgi:hypothetical protein